MTEGSGDARAPRPVPDVLSALYWQGAEAGQLVMQRCRTSGRWIHPPEPLCQCCGEAELAYEPVPPRGRVHSFVVMHDKRVVGFESDVPYANVWVELDAQPMLVLLCNLVDSELSDLGFDKPVEVVLRKGDNGVTLPQCRLVQR